MNLEQWFRGVPGSMKRHVGLQMIDFRSLRVQHIHYRQIRDRGEDIVLQARVYTRCARCSREDEDGEIFIECICETRVGDEMKFPVCQECFDL